MERVDDAVSLTILLSQIKGHVDAMYAKRKFWIVADIMRWQKHSRTGIIYAELADIDQSKNVASKCNAKCMHYKTDKIVGGFKQATGIDIGVGLKVLLCVNVEFSPKHGMALDIVGIDPNYTLGEQERKKKEIVSMLIELGIYQNNISLPSPSKFSRVAVISSDDAAGKGDFFADASRLQKYGLCEFVMFSAYMQGMQCSKDVCNALRAIYVEHNKRGVFFDAVVIIRGGGSNTDLDAFNDFDIAKAICYMPMPVFVGIGHARDKTILDEVAQASFDTPSKVVAHIKQSIVNTTRAATSFYGMLLQNSSRIIKDFSLSVDSQKQVISKSINHLGRSSDKHISEVMSVANHVVGRSMAVSSHNYNAVFSGSKLLLSEANSNLKENYSKCFMSSPERIMGLGYAIVKSIDGKHIMSASAAMGNKRMNLHFSDGLLEVTNESTR